MAFIGTVLIGIVVLMILGVAYSIVVFMFGNVWRSLLFFFGLAVAIFFCYLIGKLVLTPFGVL